MTTITDRGLDIHVLRGRLEQGYERHTQQLTHLSTMSHDADPWLRAELINGSRQVLADIARALQAMAEDRTASASGAGMTFQSNGSGPVPRPGTACPASARSTGDSQQVGHPRGSGGRTACPRHRRRVPPAYP